MPFDALLAQTLNSIVVVSPTLGAMAVFAASVLIWLLLLWYAVAFVFHRKGGPREFFALALGGSMVYLFNILISFWWWRPRPFLAQGIEPLIQLGENTKSFPSDHTALAFFLAYLLVAHRRQWWWAYFVAAAIALGRVVVGVHYPLDVLAGAAVGIAFGYLTIQVEKLFVFHTKPRAASR